MAGKRRMRRTTHRLHWRRLTRCTIRVPENRVEVLESWTARHYPDANGRTVSEAWRTPYETRDHIAPEGCEPPEGGWWPDDGPFIQPLMQAGTLYSTRFKDWIYHVGFISLIGVGSGIVLIAMTLLAIRWLS